MQTKGGAPVLPGRARVEGGAAPPFRPRPAARCQPSQPRHCRRVVRLGANTLHGASAACPKRRVRRRTGTRPPRAKLPGPRAARAKRRLVWRKVLRPVSPHRTRHPGHFPRRRKMSVLMRTKGGAPVLPGPAREGRAPPQPSAARRHAPLFCTARRPMQAEQAAALPPRSAPRSEHAARCECSVSETPRAAADRDAATPRKTSRSPRRPGQEKVGLAEGASPGWVREDRALPGCAPRWLLSPAPKQKPPRGIARSGAVVHSVFIPPWAPR